LSRRLALLLFLPTASSYHEVFTVAQLDKADAACAEAYAARPDEGFCHDFTAKRPFWWFRPTRGVFLF
jgi:hypothetical protein